MSMASGLRGTALLLALLAPLPAAAQTGAMPAPALPTEEGARAVAQAVREWLAQQTANALDLSGMQLTVRAEGDSYRMELPLGGSYFDRDLVLGDAAAVATVKPLEGGRWEIVNAALPARITGELRNRKDGTTSSVAIAIESQNNSGTLDPSLAGPSSFTTTLNGYTTAVTTAGVTQTSRVGTLSGRTEWVPSAPGRVTMQGDSTLEDYSSDTPLPGGAMAKVTIRRIAGATRIENFDMAGFGALLRTGFELGAAAQAAPDGKPAADKVAAIRLLDQLAGMMDALEGEYTYDDVRVDGGALFSGRLRQFAMALAVAAPDGKADVKLRLALEGLESPMIPPGPIAEFVPHKLTLTPRLGGVPKEAVLALLRRAVETEGADMEDEAMALLAAHPATLAIEDLLVDLGPMRLKGEGSLEVSSLEEASGEAELRATGFDALIRRVNTVKELKMAAPVLIFLKGIARQEGTETVWRITYGDRKVMVNDTDLSDLMPSR